MGTINIFFDDILFHPKIINPREQLQDIDELKASIRAVGLLEPPTVLVREIEDPKPDGPKEQYFLIIGFRRHEAIRQLREEEPNAFRTIDVSTFRGTIAEAQVRNLTENIQRSGLSPIETARAVDILRNLGYRQKDIAAKIGKSQTWVSNAVHFLQQAVPRLKNAVEDGHISFGFGRAIATLPDVQQDQQVKELVEMSEQKESGNGDQPKKAKTQVRKEVRELSGRAIRPSTVEIRDEVARLGLEKPGDLADYDMGILVALKWALGEVKTLERPM